MQLLVNVKQVAEMLGVSERHVWNVNYLGQIPRPKRLGKSVRWVKDEICEWVDAGMPSRREWEMERDATSGGAT
jgi:predicted DNA-binding transcriptional regulator AlpA